MAVPTQNIRRTAARTAAAAAIAAFIGAVAATPAAWAQQTSNLTSLFLSSGAELDFRLFGANGGAGTNGANSDRLAVSGQFNYSGSSPSSYIVGFSHGDTNALTPGTVFTLVTFGSTNFTPADAARFTAQPQDNLGAVSGNFILNSVNGGAGSLQFQITGSTDIPEPPPAFLLAAATAPLLLLARKGKP